MVQKLECHLHYFDRVQTGQMLMPLESAWKNPTDMAQGEFWFQNRRLFASVYLNFFEVNFRNSSKYGNDKRQILGNVNASPLCGKFLTD